MPEFRRLLRASLFLCCVPGAALALNGPSAITIDGGPFGQLNLSGGADGYGYGLAGTGNNAVLGNGENIGAEIGSALIQLQKSSGELQFNIELGTVGGSNALGASHPQATSITNYTTGALYEGYLTLAPRSVPGLTISAGQLASLEGYESTVDWNNANQLTTDIFFVQNSQNRGIQAAYTKGPFTGTITFGDGFDDGVWNFLQALVTADLNSNNSVSIYYAGALGRQGLNATTYGGVSNAAFGPWFMNSQMLGGWYSATIGSLNLVPELQFVYAKRDHRIGIDKPTANLGAALFADYNFSNTPYSLGAWAEYEDSTGNYSWFIGPRSQAIGASLSPTWQYKYLFARADLAGLYLLTNKFEGASYGYGNSGTGKGMFLGTLEAGVLF